MEVSPSSLLTIHAGEKATDAAAALGLMATTNSGGEKATDQTDWAQILAARLHRVKPEVDVRIIRLPGLPPKGDIVEWIRYHTQPAESDTMRAEIEEMVAETPK